MNCCQYCRPCGSCCHPCPPEPEPSGIGDRLIASIYLKDTTTMTDEDIVFQASADVVGDAITHEPITTEFFIHQRGIYLVRYQVVFISNPGTASFEIRNYLSTRASVEVTNGSTPNEITKSTELLLDAGAVLELTFLGFEAGDIDAALIQFASIYIEKIGVV